MERTCQRQKFIKNRERGYEDVERVRLKFVCVFGGFEKSVRSRRRTYTLAIELRA